jgi:parallel beta-helix repeat protein
LGWGELCDMGGVYTLGLSEGTIVGNNVIHDVYSFEYGGWGLYTDEGSTGIVMENNLVYNCKDAGFNQHFGKENIIRNNILAFNEKAQVTLARPEKHQSFSFVKNVVCFDKGDLFQERYVKGSWLKAITVVDSNCYWDLRTPTPIFYGLSFGEWQKAGKDQHSIIADPLFVDAKNFDFHFKSLKVARKIGFAPFDYTKAGVYGDQDWKGLAKLDPGLMQEFEKIVVQNSWKGKGKLGF